MKLRRDPSKRPPVARVLGGVLIFQLGLAGLLFWGDLDEGLRLPGFGPRAPATRPAGFNPTAPAPAAALCRTRPCPNG